MNKIFNSKVKLIINVAMAILITSCNSGSGSSSASTGSQTAEAHIYTTDGTKNIYEYKVAANGETILVGTSATPTLHSSNISKNLKGKLVAPTATLQVFGEDLIYYEFDDATNQIWVSKKHLIDGGNWISVTSIPNTTQSRKVKAFHYTLQANDLKLRAHNDDLGIMILDDVAARAEVYAIDSVTGRATDTQYLTYPSLGIATGPGCLGVSSYNPTEDTYLVTVTLDPGIQLANSCANDNGGVDYYVTTAAIAMDVNGDFVVTSSKPTYDNRDTQTDVPLTSAPVKGTVGTQVFALDNKESTLKAITKVDNATIEGKRLNPLTEFIAAYNCADQADLATLDAAEYVDYSEDDVVRRSLFVARDKVSDALVLSNWTGTVGSDLQAFTLLGDEAYAVEVRQIFLER